MTEEEDAAGEATPAADQSHLGRDQISRVVEEAFERVPSIGERWDRWYDIPYKILWFAQTGWRRKVVPTALRKWLNRRLSDLLQFNEFDRVKASGPDYALSEFTVPGDEHVTVPAIWVVELFPPSEIDALEKSLRENGWDRRKHRSGIYGDSGAILEMSRSRSGSSGWWDLATIRRPDERLLPAGFIQAKLPTEIDHISLRVVQVGSGLTAVVGCFYLSTFGAKLLDESWHAPHRPALVWRRRRPVVEEQGRAAIQATQRERVRLHEVARGWMRENCPGFFAGKSEPHTLIDLLLMQKCDPVEEGELGWRSDRFDSFRALGLTEYQVDRRSSSELPGTLLVPNNMRLAPGIGTDRTWAMWANEAILAAHMAKNLKFHEGDTGARIARRLNDGIHGLILSIATSDMLRSLDSSYARIRDRARVRHGHFKASVIEELRSQFLTHSMDLATTRRDLAAYWKANPNFWGEFEFQAEYGLPGKEPEREVVHMNRQLREDQSVAFDSLAVADREYREILATVASLGASLDASRTGRRALIVAFASLAVAVLTVALSDVGDSSVLRDIVNWFSSMVGASAVEGCQPKGLA